MYIAIREPPVPYPPDSLELESFLAYPPYSESSYQLAKNAVLAKRYSRDELSSILTDYNQAIGNDETALKNIQSLKEDNTVCVVTGQQLGLLGGPSYTILKAITCLLLAKKMQAIPIFWLATEDHDLHEVDHTYLIDSIGNFKAFKLPLNKDQQHRSIEDVELGVKDQKVIEDFLKQVNLGSLNLSFYKSYALTMAAFYGPSV